MRRFPKEGEEESEDQKTSLSGFTRLHITDHGVCLYNAWCSPDTAGMYAGGGRRNYFDRGGQE